MRSERISSAGGRLSSSVSSENEPTPTKSDTPPSSVVKDEMFTSPNVKVRKKDCGAALLFGIIYLTLILHFICFCTISTHFLKYASFCLAIASFTSSFCHTVPLPSLLPFFSLQTSSHACNHPSLKHPHKSNASIPTSSPTHFSKFFLVPSSFNFHTFLFFRATFPTTFFFTFFLSSSEATSQCCNSLGIT